MADHTELKRLAENHLSLGQAYTVAKPSLLLALIAENDSSRKHWQNESNNVQALMVEVARLKAENAGLQTGYEAYEQVNAELKAEVEGLRDHLRLSVSAMPRDRLRETFNAAYYGPRELGSDGEQCRAGVLAVIDAALGQGEQS